MSQSSGSRPQRSNPPSAGRGIALVVFATLIGAFLIWKGPASDSVAQIEIPTGDGGSNSPTTKQTVAPTAPTTAPPPSTAVAPAQLTITVANGSGKGGVAGDLSDKIKAGGYATVTATNAVDDKGTTITVPATVIYFDAGFEADARAVATVAGLSPASITARPNTPLPLEAAAQAAKVTVILGTDFTPGAAAAAAPSGATG